MAIEPILTWVTTGGTVNAHVRREGCDCDYAGYIVIDKPAPAGEIDDAVAAGATMTLRGVADLQRDHSDGDLFMEELLEFIAWAEENLPRIKKAWEVSLAEANANVAREVAQ